MARKPKMGLKYSFVVKLNNDDRLKLDKIQLSGINATEEVRKMIRMLYETLK